MYAITPWPVFRKTMIRYILQKRDDEQENVGHRPSMSICIFSCLLLSIIRDTINIYNVYCIHGVPRVIRYTNTEFYVKNVIPSDSDFQKLCMYSDIMG